MIKVAIEHDPSIRGTNIYIYDERPDGTIDTYQPVTLSVQRGDTGENVQPTLRFARRVGDDFLREFANALAAIGYKPDVLKANNQEIAAIKYHLEDMRKLVFENEKRNRNTSS